MKAVRQLLAIVHIDCRRKPAMEDISSRGARLSLTSVY